MILLANGCSWTFGSFDEWTDHVAAHRQQWLWPYFLAERMGYEQSVNLAEGCGSNQRIIRTTFDWLAEQTADTLKETVAVIQLTDVARYEYYQPKDSGDPKENIDHRWARVKAGLVLQEQENQQRANQRNDLRLETLTPQEESYHWLTTVLSLDSMFRHFGVEYYLWSYTNVYFNYLEPAANFYTSDRFPWLHKEEYDLHYGRWQYQRVSAQDQHPSLVQGHRELAEILHQNILRVRNK